MGLKKTALDVSLKDLDLLFPPGFDVVDWGVQRGQGRRGGNKMVMGGMSDPPRGIKRYFRLLKNIPEYSNNPDDFVATEDHWRFLYWQARNFGLNHEDGLNFAWSQYEMAERKAGRPAGSTKHTTLKTKKITLRLSDQAYNFAKSKPKGWLSDWLEEQAAKK